MNILSINFGHDASLALMRDGALVRFRELERTSRLKHQLGVTSDEILAFLGDTDIDAIDAVAIGSTQFWGAYHSDDIAVRFGWTEAHGRFTGNKPAWQPALFQESLNTKLGPYYRDHVGGRRLVGTALPERVRFSPLFVNGCPQDGAQSEALISQVSRIVDIIDKNPGAYKDALAEFLAPISLTLHGRTIPGFHVSHHYAHAAYAQFYGASEDALIASHDGGLWQVPFNAGGIYLGRGDQVIPLFSPRLFLGFLYDAACLKAGFNEAEGPGKLMGLAPYGFPSRGIDALIGEAKALLNPKIPAEMKDVELLGNKLANLAEADRNIRRGGLRDFTFDFRDTDFSIALAASAQRLVERVFADTMGPMLSRLKDVFPSVGSIALTGGFTLNCPANSLLQLGQGATAVTPLPGAIDCGVSLGGAIAVASLLGETLQRQVAAQGSKAAFLPSGLANDDCVSDARLERADPGMALAAFAARELAAGKIICLHRGESEIGPRALGHRSILAKASSASLRDHINKTKGRENWRPLAPIVRNADFGKYFHGNPESCRFMLFTYPVTTKAIPAVTHIDGTARVQTIGDDDVFLGDILKAFPQYGEPAVIVNTSFNAAGEPIVETVAHACNSFVKINADWLIVEDQLYKRKG